MAIVAADIKFKLSVKTGSAGNSTAQADVDQSLGKYISTTEITDNTLNNLFSDLTGDDNAASVVDYRCIFIHNSHATLTYLSPYIWISNQVSGGADMAIGLDTTAASAIGSASDQALTIADRITAPVGVSFSAPTTKATGIAIGNITAGQCKAVWVRRTANNTSAVDDDGGTISISGDTNA
jgi:hypothetical protein